MAYYDRTGKAGTMNPGGVVNSPKVRYIRPVNYNVAVTPYAAGGAVCLSPGRQGRPCREFAVQADLNNGTWIAIGFQGTNPLNGFQLLGGQGWIFSVSGFGENSSIIATPTNWIQGMDQAQQTLSGSAQSGNQMMLNINDFWASGNGAKAQNLIVFHMIVPGINA